MDHVIKPKFLTTAVAREAVDLVMSALSSGPVRNKLKRYAGYVVILVPVIADVEDAFDEEGPLPLQNIVWPYTLFERSFGDGVEWTAKYDEIAHSKAQQLWRGQNSDGVTDIMPHLLYQGDTPYWGGVKRHGIVVAFSGVQSYFDQMISGMIADALKALAYHAWEVSVDTRRTRDLL